MKSINFVFSKISNVFIWINVVVYISHTNMIHSADTSINDIADYIASKGYIPNETDLPKTALTNSNDNDATYILSKLSDEDLLRLLNEQPHRNEYNINEIMNVAFVTKPVTENNRLHHPTGGIHNVIPGFLGDSSVERKKIQTDNNYEPPAYFRLNDKPVDPYKGQSDPKYIALQKLKTLLNGYTKSKHDDNSFDNDDKKQLMFDILVDQLKTLCCKSTKNSNIIKGQYTKIINELLPPRLKNKVNIPNSTPTKAGLNNNQNEFMFLIINDEIKSHGSRSDELIEVDPKSIDGNSSVLLLGPVTTSLTDDQLKLVMSRISEELIKPEYISLLQQLSGGMLYDDKNLMKNFVFGPKTRRYIKPHRCNHQSKLAKVYGGPKWVVCTGYLNLNKPSLYD